MRRSVFAGLGTWIGVAAPAAATLVINNGLAPPNPANVITTDPADAVYVQAAGCDATVAHPCASPGAQTTVYWNTGGTQGIEVLQDSRLIFGPGTDRPPNAATCLHGDAEVVVDGAVSTSITNSGSYRCQEVPSGFPTGTIRVESGNASLEIDGGNVLIRGGTVTLSLVSIDSGGGPSAVIEGGDVRLHAALGGTVLIHGGTLNQGEPGMTLDGVYAEIHGGNIAAPLRVVPAGSFDGAYVRVYGVDFEIDGLPAAYGIVGVSDGHLTGTLESGETLDQDFEVAGFGTLELVEASPPQVPALPPFALGVLALGLLGVGASKAR
jgi:hypothetical protein